MGMSLMNARLAWSPVSRSECQRLRQCSRGEALTGRRRSTPPKACGQMNFTNSKFSYNMIMSNEGEGQ